MSEPARQVSPREQMLVRYFRQVPEPPRHGEAKRWLALAGGLAVGGVAMGLAVPDLCAGALLAGASLVGAVATGGRGVARLLAENYRYQKARVSVFPQPTDREVDRWFDEGLRRLRSHSLEALDLSPEEFRDAELPPIVGPILWAKNGVAPEDLVWKPGQDGMARFGVYEVAYLWLAEDQLGIFRCDYDFIRDVVLNEETWDFFYRDITAVSTHEQSSSITLPSGKSLTSVQEFRISVASERYFSVTVGSSQLKQLTGAERTPDPGTDAAMRALRAKLRASKGAAPVG